MRSVGDPSRLFVHVVGGGRRERKALLKRLAEEGLGRPRQVKDPASFVRSYRSRRDVLLVQVDRESEELDWLEGVGDGLDDLAVLVLGPSRDDPARSMQLRERGAFGYLHPGMPEQVEQTILAALGRWSARQDDLAPSVSRLFAAMHGERSAAGTLVDEAQEQLSAAQAVLMEPADAGLSRFRIRARSGAPLDEQSRETKASSLYFDGEVAGPPGMTPLSARTRSIVPVPDVARSSVYDPSRGPASVGGAIAVPLLVGRPGGQALVGVLNVFWDEPTHCTPSQLRFLRVAANVGAVAIRSGQRAEQLEAAARVALPRPPESSAEDQAACAGAEDTIGAVLRNWVPLMGHARVVVRLLPPRGDRLIVHGLNLPPDVREALGGKGQAGALVRFFNEGASSATGAGDGPTPAPPVTVEAADGRLRFSALALRSEDVRGQPFCCGDVLVERPAGAVSGESPAPHAVEHRLVAQVLAHRLGMARRLLDRHRLEKLLLKAGPEGDKESFLSAVGSGLKTLFGCDCVKFYLFRRRAGQRQMVRWYHSLQGCREATYDLEPDKPETANLRVVSAASRLLLPELGDPHVPGERTCLIHGGQAEEQSTWSEDRVSWLPDSMLESEGRPVPDQDQTVLIVPLLRGQRVIGTLEIGRHTADLPFLRQDADRLSWFGDHLALPLSRMLLRERVADEFRYLSADTGTPDGSPRAPSQLETSILQGVFNLTGGAVAFLVRHDISEGRHELSLTAGLLEGRLPPRGSPLHEVRLGPVGVEPESWEVAVHGWLSRPEVARWLADNRIESKPEISQLPLSLGLVVVLPPTPDRFARCEPDVGSWGLPAYLRQAAVLLVQHEGVHRDRIARRYLMAKREVVGRGSNALLQVVANLAREFCEARAALVYRPSGAELRVVAGCGGVAGADHRAVFASDASLTWKVLQDGGPRRLPRTVEPPAGLPWDTTSFESMRAWAGSGVRAWMAVPARDHSFLVKVVRKHGSLDPAFTALDEQVLVHLVELVERDLEAVRRGELTSDLQELAASLTVEAMQDSAPQIRQSLDKHLPGALERFSVLGGVPGCPRLLVHDPDGQWNTAVVNAVRDHTWEAGPTLWRRKTDTDQGDLRELLPPVGGEKALVLQPLRQGERMVGCIAALVANHNPWVASVLSEAGREIAPVVDALGQITRTSGRLASLAHAVRSPIHSMAQHARLLTRLYERVDTEVPAGARDATAMIEREVAVARTALAFVRRLEPEGAAIDLSFFELRPTDLAGLLVDCVDRFEVMARKRRIRFALRGCDKPLLVPIDRAAIESVLTNLVDNAVKYAFGGTEIRIGLEKRRKTVEIRVEDLGHGIPDGFEDRLYERYVRVPTDDPKRPIPGTGIGLHVSRLLAWAHGGELSHTCSKQVSPATKTHPSVHVVEFLLRLPKNPAPPRPNLRAVARKT